MSRSLKRFTATTGRLPDDSHQQDKEINRIDEDSLWWLMGSGEADCAALAASSTAQAVSLQEKPRSDDSGSAKEQ